MLLRRALPKIWQTTAHSFPIYEMGSRNKMTNDGWNAER
jgi:hypothetical protein